MEEISFTVDAGIINRLGLELVTKSETAVAELVKNAYDADANNVKLIFENAKQIGGRLIIEDDGLGMTREELIHGFMRLATKEKINNSISKKFNRPRAGRKGIGRFSTQRLGKRLTILTQTTNSDHALKLTIDWEKYETDQEIYEIKNELDYIKKDLNKTCGTILIIDILRDKWSDADIKRVYRYVAELIQPDYLKIKRESNKIEKNVDEGFVVEFATRTNHNESLTRIADPQIMMLDRALITLTGYIDTNGYGRCHLESKSFNLIGKKATLVSEYEVFEGEETNTIEKNPFLLLKDTKIAFKIFYFIGGDRNSYYGITKSELKIILEHLDKNGGIKLYRNGFRVPKYGDTDNDWLNIDKNARIGKGIPFNNNRVLGFVQLTDPEGKVFEESAGREGLIEKEAFWSLQAFVSKSLQKGFLDFASWFRNTDEYKFANPDKKAPATSSSLEKITDDLKTATRTFSDPNATDEDKVKATISIEQVAKKIILETKAAVNELEMMRVLAGLGLTIGEFIHEIKQFVPSLNGYLNSLSNLKLGEEVDETVTLMKNVFNSFLSYTSYFDSTISQNVVRELRPINLREVLKDFEKITTSDFKRRNIEFNVEFSGYDLISTPMHISEWNTILQNLYSNAKKAIIRASKKKGKILIQCYKDKDAGVLSLDFYDNGDGILEKSRNRIFDAFYTTSNPVTKNIVEENTGSGLGLYILKQIIKNRNGDIKIGQSKEEYNTCISIQLPLATLKQLEENGY